MSHRSDRRQFLKSSAAVGMGFWVAGGVQAQESKSPNEKIQVASFGVGGKGDSDSKNSHRLGKVYAVCDVDRQRLDGAASGFGVDYKYTDYRELLDQLGDRIDAVTVSTPDHCHAVIAAKAMKMGKHCYCQKPMTHSIWEARRLGEIAREMGVATQMGNQFTNYDPMRKAAYQIRAGQLGTVSEVHIWTNRPVWPQGEDRPEPKPVPAHLDWDAWIGPAPFRPYSPLYAPFKWRGWWDFGTGALGDMACHTVNLPFMALNMRDPTSVQATTTGHNEDSYPANSSIKFEFPVLEGRDAFSMYWYDGGNLPPQEVFEGVTLRVGDNPPPVASGALIIGDRGKLYAAGDYAERGMQWVGDVEELEVDYPRATAPMNQEIGHVREWFNAMRDPSKPATSNFPDYAGPLTETILLGNLAVWNASKGAGERIEWDAKNLEPTSHPELKKIVRRAYREGHEV